MQWEQHFEECEAHLQEHGAYVAHLEGIAHELTLGMQQLGSDATSLLKHVGGEPEQGNRVKCDGPYYQMLMERVACGGEVHWTDVRGSRCGRCGDSSGYPVWDYRLARRGQCCAHLYLDRELREQPVLQPCPPLDESGFVLECCCHVMSPRFKFRTMDPAQRWWARPGNTGVRAAYRCVPASEWPPSLRWDAESRCMVTL